MDDHYGATLLFTSPDTVYDRSDEPEVSGLGSVLGSVPNLVPTAGQLRMSGIRTKASLVQVSTPLHRPMLAALGAMQIAAEAASGRVYDMLISRDRAHGGDREQVAASSEADDRGRGGVRDLDTQIEGARRNLYGENPWRSVVLLCRLEASGARIAAGLCLRASLSPLTTLRGNLRAAPSIVDQVEL